MNWVNYRDMGSGTLSHLFNWDMGSGTSSHYFNERWDEETDPVSRKRERDIIMSSVNEWNPNLYDNKMGYVSSFGKGVVELLQPTKGEKILDIGCGTGDLTYEISKSGANVTGMDFSKDMIEQAKNKYPDIHFLIGDAESFRTDTKYDAIFSNAALHWMKNAEKVVESINVALQSGG